MKFGPIIAGACTAIVLAGGTVQAQHPTKSSDGEPCCSILAIDRTKAIATARDKAGKTFQFSVKDAALLKTLRVGQSVAADFTSGKVTLHGGAPCCAIIKSEVNPQEPCCGVTSINTATGVVTAQVLATGATFRFQVRDAALLRSLKTGQKVFADFTGNKVRIHGAEPCCAIIPQ